MSENWYVAMKSGDFSRISKKFHIDPVVARVLRNREIISDEAIEMFLNGGIESLYDPHLMKDVDRTCEILEEKIRNGEKIRILGDYDIDGVTSTYILYRGIRTVGGRVDTVIPNRMTDGYGLNAKLIQDALEDGIDTLITCDNGISAAAEIAQGRAGGMTILVTDHHDLPFEWKEDGSRRYSSCGADAVVNPKQEDCNYPFQGLCGAGVAFKVVQVLYERFHVEPEELMALLPYAAMGTVGDVVDLVDENRVLVKCGLKRLNEQPDLALQALIDACNLTPGTITAYHIGFVLGPCINASGRLDTAKRALELLQSKDREQAAALAAELVELNTTRKKMTEEYCQQALQI
ncbi:MAG: DHH family phosphoesterase, partial [Lachnospiraceae bacterium]